ncbi:hypothetical protein KQX54_012763 [Cotesia glomerata]|uniref:RRM domain-containing protein n=1 Tax=Cotesia glomerata TaxID=32391 RepID=A0AAV7J3X2_COTGL|nr:hypothetical protein KQX54_012763 [Cotesia glomerata]
MHVNWARWQQPIGGNSNYNFQFQSFHCAVVPQTPQTQSNISWQEQLQFQLVYLGLLTQYQQKQQFSLSNVQFGSTPQSLNSSFNRGQNYSSDNNSANNDETMEPQDFVMATRFNAFSVNFKNFNAISEDQVHEIFSVYGKIKRVKQTGSETGLCFVNFETEEDALKAAAGIKGRSDLKLRPTKDNRSKHSNDFNNRSVNNDDNNFSNGNSGENNYSNENGRKNYSDGNRSNNSYNNNDKKTDCFNACDDKIVESTSDDFSVPISSEVNIEIKTTETTELEEVSSYADKSINNTVQSSDPPVSIVEPLVEHRHEDNDTSDQRSTISTKSEVQIPELVAKTAKLSMARTSSMEGGGRGVGVGVPIEKTAVEVLVANIPEGVNVHGILQMLDKYHPIAATNILTYEPSSMRYCRIYFTSQQRAADVEAEFDNCVLLNKPLLVVRARNFVN